MKFTCHCGRKFETKKGFKIHLISHQNKKTLFWKVINVIAIFFGIFAAILAIITLPNPYLGGHNLWNDIHWEPEDVIVKPIVKENSLSFQILNNNPYFIDDVKVEVLLDCFQQSTEPIGFFLASDLVMIPSGQADVFHVGNQKMQGILNKSENESITYLALEGDYNIAWFKKNYNLYLIKNSGDIIKDNSIDNVSVFKRSCKMNATLKYSYLNFNQVKTQSHIISELLVLPTTELSFIDWNVKEKRAGGGSGGEFIDYCRGNCPFCSEYDDWSISQRNFCSYWICEEIKDVYDDTFSCLNELVSICHANSADSNHYLCDDFNERAKTECIMYDGGKCYQLAMN